MPKSTDMLRYAKSEIHTYNYSTEYNPLRYIFTGISTREFTYPVNRYTRAFNGNLTANYKTLRSKGAILKTLAASDVVIRLDATTVNRYEFYSDKTRLNRLISQTKIPGPYSTPADYDASAKAQSKLRQKIIDQKVNLGVMAVEARKVSDMIYGAATRIAGLMRDVRKLNFRKRNIRRTRRWDPVKSRYIDGLKTYNDGRDLAAQWLEIQYGVIPLLKDIHGAAETVANRIKQKQDIIRLSATSGMVVTTSVPRIFSSVPVYPPSFEGSAGSVGKAWIVYVNNNPVVAPLNQLGLLNPALVLWEATPFSFVADWFVNIGDCLLEMTALVDITILDSGSSLKTVTDGMTADGSELDYNYGRQSVVRYTRTPGLPTMPRLRLDPTPFSLKRILNAAALLRALT